MRGVLGAGFSFGCSGGQQAPTFHEDVRPVLGRLAAPALAMWAGPRPRTTSRQGLVGWALGGMGGAFFEGIGRPVR